MRTLLVMLCSIFLMDCGPGVHLSRPILGDGSAWPQHGQDASGRRQSSGSAFLPIEELWVAEVGTGIITGGLVADQRTLYVTRARGTAYALDSETGEEIGSVTFPGPATAVPAISDNQLFFVAQGESAVLIRAAQQTYVQAGMPAERIVAPLLSLFSHVVAVSTDGTVLCYAQSDTVPRWIKRLGGGLEAGPSGADLLVNYTSRGIPQPATLFCGAMNGDIWGLSLDSGIVRWRYGAQSPIVGHLGVHGDAVIAVTRRGGVLALSTRDGRLLWRRESGELSHCGPALGKDAVIMGSADGRIHRLRREDGGTIWVSDTGAPPGAAPVILENHVIVGGLDGLIRVLDLDSGVESWRHQCQGRIIALAVVNERIFCVATDRGQVVAFRFGGLR